jgi:hypothetical protein
MNKGFAFHHTILKIRKSLRKKPFFFFFFFGGASEDGDGRDSRYGGDLERDHG